MKDIIILISKLQATEHDLAQLNEQLLRVSNWDEAARFLISRQAGPLFYKKLPQLANTSCMPPDTLAAFRHSWLKTISRSMMLVEMYRQVAAAFEAAGIGWIAMKGVYLSEWLYGELGLRQFSDIDLLVKPEDGLRALDALRGIGFRMTESLLPADIQEKMQPVHYPQMIRQGVAVEVHTRLHRHNVEYQIDVDTLWEKADVKTVHGVASRVFCLEHQLLTLVQHLDKHYRKGEYQFTCLYDIVNLLDIHGAKLNEALLLDTAAAWKLREILFGYAALLETHFTMNLPQSLRGHQLPRDIAEIFNESIRNTEMKSSTKLQMLEALGSYDTIKAYSSPGAKIRYVLRMTFPNRAYLKQYYGFTSNWLLPKYYLKRFFGIVRKSVLVMLVAGR